MLRHLLSLSALIAAPALAADQPPRITVTGTGSVETAPDVATIAYSVHGEGQTVDEAVTALVAKRKAIDAGLAQMAGATPPLGGEVNVREVRARECNEYGAPRLSTGICAIIGYTADLSLQFRTKAVGDAATMTGLIGRLGGTNPQVESFGLSDQAGARRRAIAAALADARARAQAIAAGTAVRLGALLSAADADYGRAEDIVVTGSRLDAMPAPPPPPPPPIAIDAKPRPIETQARVTVSYAIVPAS